MRLEKHTQAKQKVANHDRLTSMERMELKTHLEAYLDGSAERIPVATLGQVEEVFSQFRTMILCVLTTVVVVWPLGVV